MAELDEQLITPTFKDRKVGLVVFGILEILFGGVLALIAVGTGVIAGAAHMVGLRVIVLGVVVYAAMAAWFITMGIGSIQARRWARALVLVSSWMWLAFGIVTSVLVVFSSTSSVFAQMTKDTQLPSIIRIVVECLDAVFNVVFSIAIPGALVLFYQSKNVKATCEFRDTRVRWTDQCPLPVLAVSLVSTMIVLFGGLGMISMEASRWVVPFFGVTLQGLAGLAAELAGLALLAYAAWGAYRLHMGAWWCAILLVCVGGASACVTYLRIGGPLELYQRMGVSAEQLKLMKQMNLFSVDSSAVLGGIWFVGAVGYLLWVRKYFTGRQHININNWGQ